MADFIHEQGLGFLAHLLRRLSDEFVAGATAWYPKAGVTAPPRTASTLLLLREGGPKSVTDISGTLRQSHPLVITWVRQLAQLGFVETSADPTDGRRTVVALTEEGEAEALRMAKALEVLGQAYSRLLKEVDADIYDALWRLEAACREESFTSRIFKEGEALVAENADSGGDGPSTKPG